jgi:formylglycine-generating enzyme required for sulfatase activity
MADIFLSYTHEDEARIRDLVHALEEHGWSVFWDRRIPTGKTWQSYIGQALSDAKCVIVAWSQHSITSKWVIEEANDAEERGLLIPILLDPVKPPLGLRGIQAANLTDWKPGSPSPRFDQLIQDIAGVVGDKPHEPPTEEKVTPRTQPVATPNAVPTEPPTHEPTPPASEPRKARVQESEAVKPVPPQSEKKRNILLIGSMVALVLAVVVALALWSPLGPRPPETRPTGTPTQRTFTNSIGMSFVLIPEGSFTMGSPTGESGRDSDERQHPVTISKPFYLQTTEVTQKQWAQVMGSNPSSFKDCGDGCPVENVSWDDAQEFIRRLNQKGGGKGYRLPSEAEWEYACRARSTGAYWFGDEEARLGEYAWYSLNSENKTHPVGTKKPNAWDLFDMHGNVWEWCQDWYGEYPTSQVTDPTGPEAGEHRVLRGGSWFSYAGGVRSEGRGGDGPGGRIIGIGFRVARDL